MTEQGHSHHIGTLATLAACLPQLPFQQAAVIISSLHRFASFRDPLHFDNTSLENDDPRLSYLA
jgi:hypothetical protein